MHETSEVPPTITQGESAPLNSVCGLPALDEYEILAKLGEGGMGVVYQAREKSLRRLVALKMIRAGLYASERDLARFQIEAEAAARLQHPNVVQVYHVGKYEDAPGSWRPYMVLEFVEGGNLADRLNGTPLQAMIAARLLETLAHAVGAAHAAGIVHRDLKPANVLLAACGLASDAKPQAVPKIADFGLARRIDDEGQTVAGAILGTPSYMPPEQAAGKSRVDGRADIYSLGAILYECLTGRPPFRGATLTETLQQVREAEVVPPSQLVSRLPRDLETICLKCLRKGPEDRYQKAQALADDLGRFLRGEPIHARPVGSLERLWQWCKRRPMQAALSAALVLVTVGGILGIWSQWRLAVEGRREAERRFQLALDMNLSVADLAEKLRPLAGTQSATIEKILQQAEQNYEKFADDIGTSPAVQAGKAKLLTTFSELYWLMNRSRRASDSARQAIDLWTELRENDPRNPDLREGLALSQLRYSHALYTQGHTKESADAARSSLELRRGLLEEKPDYAERQTGVIVAETSLARVLSAQGNDEEAELLREKADARLDAMSQTGPHSVRWQIAYVRSRRAKGDRLYSAWKYAEALKAYEETKRECESFLKVNGDDIDLQAELVETEAYIGWALQDTGQATRAKAAFHAALTRAETFARQDPNHVTWRRAIIHYRGKEADVVENTAALSREQLIAALKDHLRVQVDIHKLVADQVRNDPHNRQLEAELTDHLIEQSLTRAALTLLGDEATVNSSKALDDLKDARNRLGALVTLDPINRRWAKLRAQVPQTTSQVLRVLGREREAIEQQIEAAKMEREWCREHVGRYPESRRLYLDLAGANFLLGVRCTKLDDFDPTTVGSTLEALSRLEVAHHIYDYLHRERREDLQLVDKLLRTSSIKRGCLLKLGRFAEEETERASSKELEEMRDDLLKKQPVLPETPDYPECSVIRLARRLVTNVELLDQERVQLNRVEQDYLRQPSALHALQVLKYCRNLSRQLVATFSPTLQDEARRMTARGLGLRAVIEREGPLGDSVKKALADMAEVRKQVPEPSDTILNDETLCSAREDLAYATLAQTLLDRGRKAELLRLVMKELEATERYPTWQARLVLEVGMNPRSRQALIGEAAKGKGSFDRPHWRAFLRLSDPASANSEKMSLPLRVVDVVQAHLFQGGRWTECERLLEMAFVPGPETVAIGWYENLFECRMALKKYQAADEALSWSEVWINHSPEGHRRRGQLSFEQRRFERAEQAFRALFRGHDSHSESLKSYARFMLARVCLEQDKGAEASKEADTLLLTDHTLLAPFLAAYVKLVTNSDHEGAAKYVRPALAKNPEHRGFQTLAAWIDTYGPEPDKALERLEKLFDRTSRDPIDWDLLGDVYARLLKKEKARETWRKALDLMPSTADPNDHRKRGLERKLAASRQPGDNP